MTYPNITFHDAATGETIEREMTDEEYAELIASGWTETAPVEETSGERSASDPVEEEGSPNDPISDSGDTPSDN